MSKQFYRNMYVYSLRAFNNHLSYPSYLPHLVSGILVEVPHWLDLPEEHMFPSTSFTSTLPFCILYICVLTTMASVCPMWLHGVCNNLMALCAGVCMYVRSGDMHFSTIYIRILCLSVLAIYMWPCTFDLYCSCHSLTPCVDD